jgi:hypothetical protein
MARGERADAVTGRSPVLVAVVTAKIQADHATWVNRES